ncbi:MAG: ABC transporter ATP-binding protein [Deltaproteobacteria bacterium]|nr:MAG: ABC transporter ATP-binding protein [Deltaproteobacteria bacterium]
MRSGPVHIQAKGLSKVYHKGGQAIEVLREVDLEVGPGDRVSIVGPSGCGKSTFLHLVGLLDTPTSGRLLLDELDVTRVGNRGLHRFRNFRVGFIFQAHNLLPEHTALSNVMIPVQLAGASKVTAQKRATALLEMVGLGPRLQHKPGELSGGEQQRVAIARALVMGPGLVLADEPTGNLDPVTSDSVFEVLLDLNRQLGSTLVMVTHSLELARRFPRQLQLVRGQFEDLS